MNWGCLASLEFFAGTWQCRLSQLPALSLPASPSHTPRGLANMHETPQPSHPSLIHDPTNSCPLIPSGWSTLVMPSTLGYWARGRHLLRLRKWAGDCPGRDFDLST